MLVDLGRNDLGRVCRFGSVRVPEFMQVERYSHVMHIVSSVIGELADGQGRPRRAGRHLPGGHALAARPRSGPWRSSTSWSPSRRGLYGGAVGYLDLRGNLDFCIAIRTARPARTGRATVQAGAGIVADSDPAAEQRETEAKAGAMFEALRMAARRCERRADGPDPARRQLRLVHLQPLPVPRRAGGGDRASCATTSMTADEALALGARPHRDLARSRHPRPGRHQPRAHPRAPRAGPAPRRLPRAPGAGPGLRRAACVRAPKLMHGKTSEIHHDGRSALRGPARSRSRPPAITRWWWRARPCPSRLEISAWTDDGIVMGLRHREHALEGVQFHPESILTAAGKDLLRNFLARRPAMKPHLAKVAARRAARAKHEAGAAMAAIMDGEATPAQIGALLAALAVRGETEDEIVGFARTMRARAVPLRARRAPSTPAAPAATAPAPSTSRPWPRSWWRPAACRWPSTATARPAGAAAAPTCWRRWGCGSTRPSRSCSAASTRSGWTFLFAPAFHASTRHAVGPRKELGVRTAFNLLGPAHQSRRARRPRSSGVPRPELTEFLGSLPARLGRRAGLGRARRRASTRSRSAGATRVTAFDGGEVRTFTVDARGRRASTAAPARGLQRRRRARERGHRAARSSAGARGPARDVVLLNAAAALVVAGRAADLPAGVARGGAGDRRRARGGALLAARAWRLAR